MKAECGRLSLFNYEICGLKNLHFCRKQGNQTCILYQVQVNRLKFILFTCGGGGGGGGGEWLSDKKDELGLTPTTDLTGNQLRAMVISIPRNMLQHLNSVLNKVWRRLIFCLYIFYALYQAISVWISKMYSFNPEQPKWDQSLQSHQPVSETAAIIPVLFIWDSTWAFILSRKAF